MHIQKEDPEVRGSRDGRAAAKEAWADTDTSAKDKRIAELEELLGEARRRLDHFYHDGDWLLKLIDAALAPATAENSKRQS